MIVFTLKCSQDHRFEAWFRDGAAFEAQAAAGEVACPVCGATEVSKAPMAPAVVRGAGREAAPVPHAEGPAPAAEAESGVDEGMRRLRGLLTELRRQVEANCEYVGPRFPEEARRIHYGETEARPVYGEASAEEAKALAEEGIEVARIPWLPRTDS